MHTRVSGDSNNECATAVLHNARAIRLLDRKAQMR